MNAKALSKLSLDFYLKTCCIFIAHCIGEPFDEPTHNVTFEQLRCSAQVRLPDGRIGIYLPLNAILLHGDIDSKLD